MQELSITQQYFMCAVNENGQICGFSTEMFVCVVAAGLLDLQQENCIAIDHKLVSIEGPLPADRVYLEALYQFIQETKPIYVGKIVEAYMYSFSDKRLNELIEAVGQSLNKMGLVNTQAAKKYEKRDSFIPKAEALIGITDRIRVELLDEVTLSEKVTTLLILIEKSNSLKAHFSPSERKTIKSRLKAISHEPKAQLVKDMVDHVENLLAITTVMIAGL